MVNTLCTNLDKCVLHCTCSVQSFDIPRFPQIGKLCWYLISNGREMFQQVDESSKRKITPPVVTPFPSTVHPGSYEQKILSKFEEM